MMPSTPSLGTSPGRESRMRLGVTATNFEPVAAAPADGDTASAPTIAAHAPNSRTDRMSLDSNRIGDKGG